MLAERDQTGAAAAAASQVYLYYELDNYYQNHKRYVRSRDDDQLAGEVTLTNPSALLHSVLVNASGRRSDSMAFLTMELWCSDCFACWVTAGLLSVFSAMSRVAMQHWL